MVAGQTIRVADGESATWDTPLPTDATSRFVQSDDETFINVKATMSIQGTRVSRV